MLKRCFLQKAGKVAGYSMAWGYWALTGATASVIISFAGYLSTFFPVLQSKQILFNKWIFTGTRKRINFPRM